LTKRAANFPFLALLLPARYRDCTVNSVNLIPRSLDANHFFVLLDVDPGGGGGRFYSISTRVQVSISVLFIPEYRRRIYTPIACSDVKRAVTTCSARNHPVTM